MRMTAASVYRDSIASMERTSQRLLEFQEQVQSGKRINRPSDDPDGLAAAIGERAEVAAIEQYTRTGDSVTSRLTVLDTALNGKRRRERWTASSRRCWPISIPRSAAPTSSPAPIRSTRPS